MSAFRIAASILLSAVLLRAGERVWLDVPFIRQQPEGCGAASLAMTMLYWHRLGFLETAPPPSEVIYAELYRPEQHGVPADQMAAYLQGHGFRAFTLRGDWSDIERHVAAGRPLIVAFRTSAGALHYAVAAGVDSDVVALNDPADRKLRLHSRRDFERQWDATGRWTLLAVPMPGK